LLLGHGEAMQMIVSRSPIHRRRPDNISVQSSGSGTYWIYTVCWPYAVTAGFEQGQDPGLLCFLPCGHRSLHRASTPTPWGVPSTQASRAARRRFAHLLRTPAPLAAFSTAPTRCASSSICLDRRRPRIPQWKLEESCPGLPGTDSAKRELTTTGSSDPEFFKVAAMEWWAWLGGLPPVAFDRIF